MIVNSLHFSLSVCIFSVFPFPRFYSFSWITSLDLMFELIPNHCLYNTYFFYFSRAMFLIAYLILLAWHPTGSFNSLCKREIIFFFFLPFHIYSLNLEILVWLMSHFPLPLTCNYGQNPVIYCATSTSNSLLLLMALPLEIPVEIQLILQELTPKLTLL